MGKIIFLDWGRLMAITSGIYTFWAAVWGLFFRKFFWDNVGAVLGPAGLIPPQTSKIFETIIVDFPIAQIINIINALLTLCLVYPLPIQLFHSTDHVRNPPSVLERNLALRTVFWVWCAFWAVLVYQTLDASLFYLVTAAVYVKAASNGERLVKPMMQQSGGRGSFGMGGAGAGAGPGGMMAAMEMGTLK